MPFIDPDCPDCPPHNGKCEWAGCHFDADYRIKDVIVKRHGEEFDVGHVYLCGGHHRRLHRLGRLELDWERILKAAS